MALKKLKNLFEKNIKPNEEENTIFGKIIEQSYEDWGFEKAKHHHGSRMSFIGHLSLVKEHYKKTRAGDTAKQEIEANKAQVEFDKKQEKINFNKNFIEKKESKKNDLKTRIDNLKRDIISIRENPASVMPDKMSKVSFIIGLIILSILTIYLFIFYSSASYSALFKRFTLNEIGVANSIFDPQALSIAYQSGVTELILILTVPAIFLGLGFLIHKFQEQEGISKFLKIGILMIITFVFDVILAYEITEKIYNIKAQNSFQNMPEYTVEMAFQSVNFWLIIFAGFIVYLIWGFVFDFTMESYDKLNIIKQAIKAKETEIKIYEEDIHKINNEIEKINAASHELETACINLRNIIDGAVVIIDWTAFEKKLLEFTSGWTHWMTANMLIEERIDEIHQECSNFLRNNKQN